MMGHILLQQIAFRNRLGSGILSSHVWRYSRHVSHSKGWNGSIAQSRGLTATLRLLHDAARSHERQKQAKSPNEGQARTVMDSESPKQEQSADRTPVQDALLTEKSVSDKEQRKADWAIIKEMSQYLWPKDNLGTRLRVGASVALLVGAKVCKCCGRNPSVFILRYELGPQCPSSLLFQEHRRRNEH